MISEFKDGERINGQFLVVSGAKCVNNSGGNYMNLELRDSSGNINAKKWDYNEKDEGRSKDILRFFIRHNGDFSFLDLITDNVSFPEGFPHRLGQSFITLIKPGESFRYIVLGDEPIDEDKSFGNFIVSAPKRFVECNIVVIDDCFIYNGTCIVVKRDYAY